MNANKVISFHLRLTLVWLGALLFVATTAGAQPGGGLDYVSLEARLLQTPVVFQATLTNFAKTLVHPGPPDHPYAAYDYTLTFRVNHVFKGGRTNQPLVLKFADVGTCVEFERWTTNRDAFLLFASNGETEASLASRFFGEVNFILLGPTVRGKNLMPEPDTFNRVYDQNLIILTQPADILNRARAFARNPPATTNTHKFYLPEPSSIDHYFFNCYLTVPVDPLLENTARHLIAAPDDFIAAKTNAARVPQWRCDLRAEGVGALQYFKSPRNLRLLKSLLTAPDCDMNKDWSAQYQSRNAIHKNYVVRRRAFEVLQGWDIPVPRPVTEEVSITK